MTQTTEEPPAPRSRAYEERKAELVAHAMACLSQRGYAQTSLRDIAHASGMSLGRVHYYFDSKKDLIITVVTTYKEQFLRELTMAVESVADPLQATFAASEILVQAIRHHAPIHRLWYNLRVEALFDRDLRPTVDTFQQVLSEFFYTLFQRFTPYYPANTELPDLEATYLLIDAFFFRALQEQLDQPEAACERFATAVRRQLMPWVMLMSGKGSGGGFSTNNTE